MSLRISQISQNFLIIVTGTDDSLVHVDEGVTEWTVSLHRHVLLVRSNDKSDYVENRGGFLHIESNV